MLSFSDDVSLLSWQCFQESNLSLVIVMMNCLYFQQLKCFPWHLLLLAAFAISKSCRLWTFASVSIYDREREEIHILRLEKKHFHPV